MTALYCVFGNPVAHSRSPDIHHAFAAQRDEDLRYEKREAPLEDFAGAVNTFHEEGGLGANVTVPFKEQAFDLCDAVTERAGLAAAVNTLWWDGDQLHGDNTDGAGLVKDIRDNLGWAIQGKRVLVLGAGGAVRGVMGPLLAEEPTLVRIANRTEDKAAILARGFMDGTNPPVLGSGLDNLSGQFDLVINAISAGLHGEMPALPEGLLAEGAVAYDMVYGSEPTSFMVWAQQQGAVATADGLGMLVEQAAEAFEIWRGWRPDSAPVIAGLR
ncbi:shikimate dehydrogenase [Alcanivorax sp.]|uniref:shikimate dehydrogenase n=1 Tax=Alcanivorax sp. TaxID=1872427 RepID=UPI0025B8404B|nr:shikimate dehydrogenase [Alcanivorax sp.]